jgi:hypothetical protein
MQTGKILLSRWRLGGCPRAAPICARNRSLAGWKNLPGPTARKRMMAAMVEVFCDSFEQVPRRILLDIDDTEDRVHGGQQLALFNAYYDSRCFQPIHIYEATTGKPVAIILRPGETPVCAPQPVSRGSSARISGSHYGRNSSGWCR